MGTLELTLPARPESVGIARRRVAELGEELNLNARKVDDLRTVVSEACMNAAVHAYPTGPGEGEAEFELSAQVQKEAISVTVVDEGTGICPRPASDSSSARLGLLLMAALASRLEIRSRSGGGTSLRIELS